MPSVFAEYAVDYDGDGRRDLWNSVPDAMASAANFLRGIGWEPGWRWGREVTLPADFPYELAGYDGRRTMRAWKELGVRTAYDRPLSGADVEAALIVPSGHEGPKFLVYDNFEVIMRWNQSEFYALSVGHLADRLAGAAGLANPPPEDAPRMTRDDVIALQERLNERGFDAGPADGIPGPRTRAAIRRFQKEQGMIADGFASREVLDRLSLRVAEHTED
jgi:membrane-bound lytic murein transglycosylase B